jgi:hypothetical protein
VGAAVGSFVGLSVGLSVGDCHITARAPVHQAVHSHLVTSHHPSPRSGRPWARRSANTSAPRWARPSAPASGIPSGTARDAHDPKRTMSGRLDHRHMY